MGFSVSGSAAIIFIGLVVAVGIAVPPVVGSFGSLAGAQGEQVDRGIDALNTEFEIESATYNGTDKRLTLELVNTGSTTLAVAGTSVLLEGVIPESTDVTTRVDGDENAELWLPGQRLMIEIEGVTAQPDRVKVVAENGIAETAQGEEITA